MISIAAPLIILLKQTEINLLSDTERNGYAWDNGFFIQDARLKDIELRINFFEGYDMPRSLSIYYFRQVSSNQVRQIDLKDKKKSIKVVTEEADFWKVNPLYVDKIGILASGLSGDCRIKVEAFKYI